MISTKFDKQTNIGFVIDSVIVALFVFGVLYALNIGYFREDINYFLSKLRLKRLED